MTPREQVDYIVHDCFFAIGQTVGKDKRLDYGAVMWLGARYREKFLRAMTLNGASWARDRRRVTAVARFLGLRAAYYAGDGAVIDRACAAKASAEVESGCRMQADRDAAEYERPGTALDECDELNHAGHRRRRS